MVATGIWVSVTSFMEVGSDEASPRLGAARTVADIGLHQYDAETILKKLDEIETRQRR